MFKANHTATCRVAFAIQQFDLDSPYHHPLVSFTFFSSSASIFNYLSYFDCILVHLLGFIQSQAFIELKV